MMLRPRSAHPAWVFSSVVCCLLLSLVYFPLSKIVASSPARILPSAGKPLVNFKTPQSAKIAYTGAPDAVAALESGKANPTALASADFDADGAVDVVAGYSSKNGGVLALYKANPDAFAPTDTSLYQKAVEGNVPPTFLPNAKVFVLPESPDLIVTGDFNLDGRKDVLVAARGGSLYFLAGDGHGNFAAPQLVTTAGPVLAMAVTPAGHVAVSTDGRKGPQITILMPGSAGLKAGQTFSLPARGTSLEWGTLGGGADLAVGAGSSVVVIYNALLANPETETVSLPFQVRGLALGAFIWDRDDRTEIAVLADDGSISILQHGTLNLTPLTPAEATARRTMMAKGGGQPAPDPTELGPWTIAKRLPQTVSAPAGPLSPSAFNSPHMATTSTFDLMVIDAGRSQLSILDTSGNTTSPSTDISFSGRPVAALALPQKINAGRDLVVLAEGQSAPILAPETGATTYSVTNTADEDDINACPETSSPNGTPPIVGSGATTGAGTDGKLSLREAVCEANNQAAYNVAHSAAAGNYIINVPAGTYNLSLVTGGNWPVPPCDCPNNYWDGETGELFTGSVAGESMSIVGMGTTPASTTITQTDGVDRIMEQDWNFVGNIPISLSNMTLSGGNCLRYVDGAPGDCVSGGGAVFAGGSAGSTLTITSVVMQNNNDGGTCEGFCNAPPNNIINGEGGALAYFGPTLMLSGSTFSGNTAAQAPLNGVGFGGAFLFANNYGGTASMGAQTITNSIFTNNSTGVGGALELQIGTGSAVNISGSKFTGNQAQEDTGFTKAPSSIGGAIDASVGSGGYTLTVSDSRIVGNSATDGTGFSIQSGGTATITDNWWGCNAGPGNSGCDSVYANSATATFSPYLKLSASANPNPINTNTSTTVTVDLTHDSNGGSGFSVPTGTPVSYGSPTLGTISGFPSSLTSGTASGTFAAGGSSGMGTVPVTVDNQTVTADITINQAATPPTLSISMTNSPASFTQGDPSDTYTITVTNTGQSATSGTISLSDTLPTGLSEVSFTETAHSGGGTGSDWSCSGTSCSRTSAMAAGESDTLTLTISVLYTAPIGTGSVTNSAQVSGGGASNSPTASDPTTIIGGPVSVSFNTNPSGLQVTVDSSTYTSQKVLSLTNGSTHTISVTSPQTANGVQNTWTSWSDGGAISHQITISSTTGDARSQNGAGSTKSHSPLTPTGISYTANFATTYQLTTAVSPAGAGTVTMPTSGTYYAANAPVSVSATANTGYVFEDWSGGTFDNAAQASTTFTMPSQPATMTANFQALAPPQSTTTVITSSQNPSFTMSPNNSTTFTATVTYGGGHPVGVGTVTFSQGNNNLSCSQGNPAPLSNGQAFCTTSFTTEGDPVITAQYNGYLSVNTSYSPSSGFLSQEVDNHTTGSGPSGTGNQWCNSGSIGIPSTAGAAAPYASHIFVTATENVGALTVNLNGISSSDIPNTDLLLVGPTGAQIIPFANVGDTSNLSGVNITLSDTAGSLLPAGSPLTSGTFEPSSRTGATSLIFPAPAPATTAGNYAATDGTATLFGVFGNSSATGTWSLYAMANSSSGAASINNGWCLNITPQAAPMITSMNSASFALGSASSFPVTATGSPTPSISESGALPNGVSFHTSTGTLSGTPMQAGTFNIIFTASNGVGQNATQNFTLTVPKGGTETTVQSYDAATNALWSSSEVTGASAYATSTVSPVSGGGPTPTSNVTYDLYGGGSCGGTAMGSSTQTLSGGSVPQSSTFGPLSAGNYSFQTSYSGDNNYNPSTSSCVPFSVGQAKTSIAVTTVSPSSEAYGQDAQVSITAMLSWTGNGPAPTAGDITIGGNGPSGGYSATSCGSPSGNAITCMATYTPTAADTVGSYTESASFSGDSNYQGSSTTATNNFSITQATSGTSTLLTSGTDPSTYGSAVTFTATVGGEYGDVVGRGGALTGRKGSTRKAPAHPDNLGGATISWSANTGCSSSAATTLPAMATCTTSVLPVGGSNTVTATYSGDTNHSGSYGSAMQAVNQQTPSINVTTVLPGSEGYGQDMPTTITATLTWTGNAAAPTASDVSISTNAPGGTLGTTSCMPAGSGTLTCSASFTPDGNTVTGTYTMSASFSGDTNYATASSLQTNNFSVSSATSSTSVTSGQNPSLFGQPVTFKAVIGGEYGEVVGRGGAGSKGLTRKSRTHPENTGGTVTWSANTGCSANSVATLPATVFCTTSALPAGNDTITASYSGDSNHGGSAGMVSGGQAVDEAPAITSANKTTFPFAAGDSFQVTTTGYPAPAISESGALPMGVSFMDNHDGTGTLSGTPSTGGVFSISFTAANGIGSNATQSFTLTVNQPPAITSPNSAVFTIGAAGSFTVTTTGLPYPSITEAGPLPTGLTFVDNGNGTASLKGTPLVLVGGDFSITVKAQNGVGSPATQAFTIVVQQGPTITSANSATFAYGVSNSFTVTTAAFPIAGIAEAGGLPPGVTFVDNHNGTATLSGIPNAGGSFPLVLTATNAVTATQQNFTLNVSGLNVSPQNLSFGTLYLNGSSTLTVTVTNVGPSTVTITGDSITPGTANSATYQAISHCGSPLKPGKSCTFSVTFLANLEGTLTATMYIMDNGLGTPQQVDLTGNVIDPVAQFNPTSLSFGSVVVHNSKTLAVQLTNSGQTPLDISNISIGGTDAADYSQTNNCPAILSAAMNCTISVTFDPAAKGARSGMLIFTDNVAKGQSTVALTGTGH